MKLASLRLLLATAVHVGWSLRLLDVCAAFLMTKLPDNEAIYMAPFEGMKVKEGYDSDYSGRSMDYDKQHTTGIKNFMRP